MSQFITPPPLTKIATIFVNVTGQALDHGASWSTWVCPANVEALREVIPYYRPCHQKLINELLKYPAQSPLALLRQLLRPHDITIERKGDGSWQLVRDTHVIRTIGGRIIW